MLSSTAPNPSTYFWRASIADGGNPGTTDAAPFSGGPLADSDYDGQAALVEYSMGKSDAFANPSPWTFSQDNLGRWLVTFPRALNADDATLAIESQAALGDVWLPATATLLSSTGSATTAFETWQVIPPAGSAKFFIRLKATLR